MKITDIFLDVDGVLGDFYGQAFRAFGKPAPRKQTDWPERGRKMPEAVGANGWTEIHERIPRFWRDQPLLTGATELIEILQEHCKQNPSVTLRVLTSPPNHAPAYSDRIQRLAELGLKNVIFCKEKHLIAGTGRLLIDDTPQNCEAWSEAGGKSFLWRQPWNTNCPETGAGTDPWENPWTGENLRLLTTELKTP